MTIFELDAYFKTILKIADFSAYDASQNGLQVENTGGEVKKVAFAVDACLQTVLNAAERGADVLFVHHGLFWGKGLTVTGAHYRRLKALFEADMALYAVHLPLDSHPLYGNNAGLANRLSLEEVEPFGLYRGIKIGLKGVLPDDGFTLENVCKKLFPKGEKPCNILPFGKKNIRTVGIISGGAAKEISEAISFQLDLYITGEIEHAVYHEALENKINVIAGGHYQTETVGVQLVARKLEKDTGLETCFIDVPTGL